MSNAIWDKLRLFSDIIIKVEDIRCEQDVDTEIVKAKIILTDGSNLRISESIVDEQLVSYSYYWLDECNRLIIGWDNASHHKDIKTFLHHKHIRKKTNVTSSKEHSLNEVLRSIYMILEK